MFCCLKGSLPLSNNNTKQFEIRLHSSHLSKSGCSLIFEPDGWKRLISAWKECKAPGKFFSGLSEQPGLFTEVVQVWG